MELINNILSCIFSKFSFVIKFKFCYLMTNSEEIWQSCSLNISRIASQHWEANLIITLMNRYLCILSKRIRLYSTFGNFLTISSLNFGSSSDKSLKEKCFKSIASLVYDWAFSSMSFMNLNALEISAQLSNSFNVTVGKE